MLKKYKDNLRQVKRKLFLEPRKGEKLHALPMSEMLLYN